MYLFNKESNSSNNSIKTLFKVSWCLFSQALIELCVGNFANQAVAVNGQVVDSINAVLHCTKESHPKIKVCNLVE